MGKEVVKPKRKRKYNIKLTNAEISLLYVAVMTYKDRYKSNGLDDKEKYNELDRLGDDILSQQVKDSHKRFGTWESNA